MDKEQVASHWAGTQARADAFSPHVYWLAVPAVQRRIREKGGKGQHWLRHSLTFLRQLPVEKILVLGSGKGMLERNLWRLGAFKHCDAFDISNVGIDRARQSAIEEGIQSITYTLADIEGIDFPRETYDAAWVKSTLHHIFELEKVCAGVAASLKPGGYFFLNEYVGPNGFRLSQQRIELIKTSYALIPDRYKKNFKTDGQELKKEPYIPDPDEVAAVDPSEAARSEDILPVLERYFEVVEKNECGGGLLHFVLSGIAGNFREEDATSMRILEMLFGIEDGLMAAGELQSDLCVIVARRK